MELAIGPIDFITVECILSFNPKLEIKLLSKLNNIKLLNTRSFKQVEFPFEIFEEQPNSVLARNQRNF